ncbi:SWI/SNF-related matrix-associated actin-dependent regulator of chromatin subfamily A-like protein 1-like, partial [Trifolium pratense]
MEPEDWDLSGEDLDSLEREAYQKIAQLRSNPTHPPSSSSSHSANPPPQRSLPPSFKSGGVTNNTNDHSKEFTKASVKFFLHSTGLIAAKFQYDQVIVAAFRKIPKSSWNAKER